MKEFVKGDFDKPRFKRARDELTGSAGTPDTIPTLPGDTICDKGFVVDLVTNIINDSVIFDPLKDKLADRIDRAIIPLLGRLPGGLRLTVLAYVGMNAVGAGIGDALADQIFKQGLKRVIGILKPVDVVEPARILTSLIGSTNTSDICTTYRRGTYARLTALAKAKDKFNAQTGFTALINLIEGGFFGEDAKNTLSSFKNYKIGTVKLGEIVFSELGSAASSLVPESKQITEAKHWQKLAGIK